MRTGRAGLVLGYSDMSIPGPSGSCIIAARQSLAAAFAGPLACHVAGSVYTLAMFAVAKSKTPCLASEST